MPAYNECFAQGVDSMNVTMDGVPAIRDGWQTQFAQLAPAAPNTPASASARLAAEPEWESFIQTEADLESIDWTCRESVYEQNPNRVDAAISAFETDHSDEIERARAAWTTIETRAAAIGFHGQAGSLD